MTVNNELIERLLTDYKKFEDHIDKTAVTIY